MNFYNENDRKSAAWLRELIRAGEMPKGDVDERSITELNPNELIKYTQCHFFAGIAGWPYALRLAGWPEDRPVWTGSCPCQPYSSAGAQRGQADSRNLWPAFFRLIKECRPDSIFGEQVASAIGFGWLDGIQADLEAEGYAVGHCVLGAHSVGAPHKRQRLYWMADTEGERWKGMESQLETGERERAWLGGSSATSRMVNSTYTPSARFGQQRIELPGQTAWQPWEILPCTDGKSRRIESGLQPLAHGVPGRVGLLRGYGNAIVPQVAAEFIKAFSQVNL